MSPCYADAVGQVARGGSVASVVLALGGCHAAEEAAASSGGPNVLLPAQTIAAESWGAASVAEDPFVEYEPGRVRCSPFAYRLEASWLEVTTTSCNYATLVYRFMNDVSPGDVISGEIAWATLASIEPAVGTLAFATAAEGVLWTHEVDIPGSADILELDFELTQAAPAGSGLYFHVRNHGYNTWQLSPLSLGP